LIENRRIRGILKSKWRKPSETGYIPHLYTISGTQDEKASQLIELKVMQAVDSAAARALLMIEAGGEAASNQIRAD